MVSKGGITSSSISTKERACEQAIMHKSSLMGEMKDLIAVKFE